MNYPSVIGVASDHAGFDYKTIIIPFLQQHGIEVKDFGTYSSESADYPDFVHPLCNAIEAGDFDFGVLICGSANGVAITANKHQGIRAALCWREDIAQLSRLHNNANIICIPARFTEIEDVYTMLETFFTTDFEGGRHQKRVDKISC